MKGIVWRGWMTSLPCLVLSDAEGLGRVDERRTETADRAARYQADYQRQLGYATRTTNCCRYLEGALCFGLRIVSLWFLVSFCQQVIGFFLSLSPVRFFQASAPSPAGGIDSFFFHCFLFSFFDLSSLLLLCSSLFRRICIS